MAKFATPVAMKVTKEQGKYLLDKLISIGYEEEYRYDEGYIATNWNDIHYAVAIASHKPGHRHIIEEYNPELFLAIAAMTEDEIPIVGEWLNRKSVNTLFRVNSYGNSNYYQTGEIDKGNPNGSGNYRKATLEELTNHFSKPKETFVLPKKWKLEVTEENVDAVNKWKTSLGKCTILSPGHAVDQDGYWSRGFGSMITKSTVITTEQFMEHVYNPTFKQDIPEEFYVKYCEEFTEEFYEALRKWAKQNSTGPEYGYCKSYDEIGKKVDLYYIRFNFSKTLGKRMSYTYGLDNNNQSTFKTEYTIEQVKKLINYKPKTNKNEYKEDSYEKECREIKQIDEDLDSISSREGGKEIKIRTVSSRNLCQRGSIESPNSITSPRGSSSRIRAERGRLYI